MHSTTDVTKAAQVIRKGGVIAYPTETLPGLGCLASSETAVKKLLHIKQRAAEKGLILLASNIKQLPPWITPLNKALSQKLSQPVATPTTWLIPANESANPLLKGKHRKLAVRITSHPVAQELCDQVGEAIVSTSINLTGEAPALHLSEISPIMLEQLDLVLVGTEGSGQPSEIRDLLTAQRQR